MLGFGISTFTMYAGILARLPPAPHVSPAEAEWACAGAFSAPAGNEVRGRRARRHGGRARSLGLACPGVGLRTLFRTSCVLRSGFGINSF